MVTPEALAFSVDLFGHAVPAYRIAVIVVGAAVAIGLTAWLRLSRAGLFVRAASTDPVTTAMQGVNTDRLSAFVVGLGCALAGLAGVVAAPFLSLSPSMSSDVIIDVRRRRRGRPGQPGRRLHRRDGAGHGAGARRGLAARLLVLLPFLLMVAIPIWKPAGFAGSRTSGATTAKTTHMSIATTAALALRRRRLRRELRHAAVAADAGHHYAIFALGVGLLLRQNGMVSFGHALYSAPPATSSRSCCR